MVDLMVIGGLDVYGHRAKRRKWLVGERQRDKETETHRALKHLRAQKKLGSLIPNCFSCLLRNNLNSSGKKTA